MLAKTLPDPAPIRSPPDCADNTLQDTKWKRSIRTVAAALGGPNCGAVARGGHWPAQGGWPTRLAPDYL